MFIYVYISILFIIAILYVKNFRNMLNKLLILALLFVFTILAKGLYNYGKQYIRLYAKPYHNIIPEVMIEDEYIKTLSMSDVAIYKSIPSSLKKKKMDEFISNNKDLVNKINIESAQNYVNGVITDFNENAVNKVDVINKISTQPFVISLDNGAILNVVPVVKKIIMDEIQTVNVDNENSGVVHYDLESTIANVKSQIDIEDEREKEVLYKEIDGKVFAKIVDFVDSGLKAASISAVATSLSI